MMRPAPAAKSCSRKVNEILPAGVGQQVPLKRVKNAAVAEGRALAARQRDQLVELPA